MSDSLDRCPTGTGLDCSGSFIWAYNQIGAGWGDNSAQGLYNALYKVVGCTLVSMACWQIGDAVFLGTAHSPTEVYHVSMYLGNNQWGDCYNTGTGCVIHDVRNIASYVNDFVGVGRPSATYGWEQCDKGTPSEGTNSSGGLFGIDIWAPIRWLAQKVAEALTAAANLIIGAFVPSASDWAEINADLEVFYQREPIGTISDIAGFMTSIKEDVAGIDVEAPAGYTDVTPTGPYAAVMAPFSITAITNAGSNTLDMIADLIGPAVGVIKVLTTISCFLLLVYYIRSRFILTA
jgi:hypothetical protein